MCPVPANPADGADDTVELLARAKAGERDALERLFARHIPALRRWARGRLPRWARDIADTSDIVQDSVLQTFRRIESFEPRGDGALQAYLRQALVNHLRNQLRRVGTRPQTAPLETGTPDEAASPLEVAIGSQTLERYEAALGRLSIDERDAIVSRIEFGMSYAEIAAALGKPTADAARQSVVRALKRLMDEMSNA